MEKCKSCLHRKVCIHQSNSGLIICGHYAYEKRDIFTLEKVKEKIANYEMNINKAYTGDNDNTIIFNTVYSIIDTQIEIIKGSRTDQTGAEEPNKSVISSEKKETARKIPGKLPKVSAGSRAGSRTKEKAGQTKKKRGQK